MKDMYYVAVYDVNGVIEVISTRKNSPFYEKTLASMKYLEETGAKLLQFFVTNDKTLHLKAKLKARLLELRSLTANNERYIEEHDTKDEVAMTLRMLRELELNQMYKVARVVERLLERDVEVTDDLAIECYNYKQRVDRRF